MGRDRLRAAEGDTATTESRAATGPASPGPDVAAALLSRQGTGGNQMVLRLLADAGPAGPAGDDLAGRIRGRLGGGRPLEPGIRADVETGLGQPLGDVRLHTDSAAAGLAGELNARAFTAGADVFFNSGAYDPGTPRGYAVLAHELTHTVQQAAGPVAGRHVSPDLVVSSPHDADERHARSTAQRVVAQRDTGHAPTGGGGATAQAGAGPLSVQRHSSWEHTLLGDTPPAQLGKATVQAQSRKHLLADLWERMMFFSADATRDPRNRFPDVRWIQFRNGLWASNGELNALADYLPDPAAADTMTREQLTPVLQKMRSGIVGAAGAEFGLRGNQMTGMATHWMEYVTEAGGEVKALDAATAGLGVQRYAGLLSRNACHFAPFSWHRWEQYHNEAIEEARAHHASRTDTGPLGDVPRTAGEHARQALLKNGYGDHFLQDSFAAGHLVNKTLVMQWWVDYLNEASVTIPGTDVRIVRRGQPDPDVMRRMGSAAQTGIAGRHLYDDAPEDGPTNRDDRQRGTGAIDPQTAQERADRERRLSGSGVTGATAAEREANYQAYLRLLNNAQAQGAAGATHDHFNALGLTVVSADGSTTMRVGGDDTLISRSGPIGAESAAQAAALSRQAVDEVMNTGTTAITVEQVFALVPTKVVVDGVPEPVPLEQWQDQVLRDLCFNKIFPEYYRTLASAVIGAFGTEMVPGGMSRDAGRPPTTAMGDFPELQTAGGRPA